MSIRTFNTSRWSNLRDRIKGPPLIFRSYNTLEISKKDFITLNDPKEFIYINLKILTLDIINKHLSNSLWVEGLERGRIDFFESNLSSSYVLRLSTSLICRELEEPLSPDEISRFTDSKSSDLISEIIYGKSVTVNINMPNFTTPKKSQESISTTKYSIIKRPKSCSNQTC